MLELYSAQVACRVADISQRKLDYWIATGLLVPHSRYQSESRSLFLFSFRELVQLRAISAFRRAGLPLQKIRSAVRKMTSRGMAEWQSCWLVTDGKNAYLAHNPTTLESLTGSRSGQLAFSVLALQDAHRDVEAQLVALRAEPYAPSQARGRIVRFARSGAKGGYGDG
jgi:DNA-binding transcriptional MerR regulator